MKKKLICFEQELRYLLEILLQFVAKKVIFKNILMMETNFKQAITINSSYSADPWNNILTEKFVKFANFYRIYATVFKINN